MMIFDAWQVRSAPLQRFDIHVGGDDTRERRSRRMTQEPADTAAQLHNRRTRREGQRFALGPALDRVRECGHNGQQIGRARIQEDGRNGLLRGIHPPDVVRRRPRPRPFCFDWVGGVKCRHFDAQVQLLRWSGRHRRSGRAIYQVEQMRHVF